MGTKVFDLPLHFAVHPEGSNAPTYMKTHILEIALNFVTSGCGMNPGKDVTDRKYCGLEAAMCKAATPPFDGPAT